MCDTQYIYLLQECEFVNSNKNVYKIGKTTQRNTKRFSQYPKGSILLLQIICINCNNCEKQIIQLFTQKYKLRKDIGNEYFEGNYHNMIVDFFELVVLEQQHMGGEDVVAIDEDAFVAIDIVAIEKDSVVEELVIEVPDILEDELIVDNYIFNHENNPINCKYYSCEKCRYKTYVKQNYDKHLHSDKHKIITESTEEFTNKCTKCDKIILSRTSLWRHIKNCKFIIPEPTLEQKTHQLKLLINKIITDL
jgi:hypothetical protein